MFSLEFTSGNRSSTEALKVGSVQSLKSPSVNFNSADKAKDIAEEARNKKAAETSQDEQK